MEKKTLYTLSLSAAQADRLEAVLTAKTWEAYGVAHARFAYRGPGVNVVFYNTGKLVVQGKAAPEFIEFEVEGKVTGQPQVGYAQVHHPEWFQPHAGLDECGKGDVFGPLVVACVIAEKPQVEEWVKLGIADSKTLADSKVKRLAQCIRQTPSAVIETAQCSMEKYNQLMGRPGANLNRLLAWLHARCLEKALLRKPVAWGLLDQFSKAPLVQGYFKGKEGFQLHMRPRAESDPVVAAASVVARQEFLDRMEALSNQVGSSLPKGAGPPAKMKVKELLERLGPEGIIPYAKIHFKTVQEAL